MVAEIKKKKIDHGIFNGVRTEISLVVYSQILGLSFSLMMSMIEQMLVFFFWFKF